MKKTDAQLLLATHLRELGFKPKELRFEFAFYRDRKWRCDIAIPSERLLFECDGGMWSGGHKRGRALEDDYDKQNFAQLLGWRLLRFSNQQIESGHAKAFLASYLIMEMAATKEERNAEGKTRTNSTF